MTGDMRMPPYIPHPIEAESFRIIAALRDWAEIPEENRYTMQRLVHTAGDPDIVPNLRFSAGAVEAGVQAILRRMTVVTDVTMVQSGLKRQLLERLEVPVWCGVHSDEAHELSRQEGLTRSAAGMRLAQQRFGDACLLAIGDAPTAIVEALHLIGLGWRPALVIGLPVGFVGTTESKAALWECTAVPRITNVAFRGGSPWASTVVNALLIEANQRLAHV